MNPTDSILDGLKRLYDVPMIPLPPRDYDLTAQAMFLAQHLKENGYEPLAALLVKEEKAARIRTPRKRKVVVGKVSRKSAIFFIDSTLLDREKET